MFDRMWLWVWPQFHFATCYEFVFSSVRVFSRVSVGQTSYFGDAITFNLGKMTTRSLPISTLGSRLGLDLRFRVQFSVYGHGRG